jgi:hypothetical protein
MNQIIASGEPPNCPAPQKPVTDDCVNPPANP